MTHFPFATKLCSVLTLTIAALWLAPVHVHAQQAGGFGGTGGLGGFGGATGGLGGLGTGATGSFGSTGGGFGNTGGGGATGGGTAAAGGLGTLTLGTYGTLGNNPFGSGTSAFSSRGISGYTPTAATTGVGGGAGGLTNPTISGAVGAATLGRSIGGRGGAGGAGAGGRGFNTNQNSQNTKPTIRATAVVGFDYSRPTSMVQTQAVNARMSRLPLPSNISGVQVEVRGRTVVLLGTVPTVADGIMAERLLSLEPGIDAVDNQLQYSQPTLRPEVVPAPR